MKRMSLEAAVEAMSFMERGRPYSLHPDDRKRKLLVELERLAKETGITPVVIGGLAVSHHGYVRTTVDVDILVTEGAAGVLFQRLKRELGWKRYGEGFKNTILDVGLDICVAGRRTSPKWDETFPDPGKLRVLKVRPLPVPALPDVIALKAMSGRSQDEADIVNLLKVRPAKMASICGAARKRLRTAPAKALLDALARRAREELAR